MFRVSGEEAGVPTVAKDLQDFESVTSLKYVEERFGVRNPRPLRRTKRREEDVQTTPEKERSGTAGGPERRVECVLLRERFPRPPGPGRLETVPVGERQVNVVEPEAGVVLLLPPSVIPCLELVRVRVVGGTRLPLLGAGDSPGPGNVVVGPRRPPLRTPLPPSDVGPFVAQPYDTVSLGI